MTLHLEQIAILEKELKSISFTKMIIEGQRTKNPKSFNLQVFKIPVIEKRILEIKGQILDLSQNFDQQANNLISAAGLSIGLQTILIGGAIVLLLLTNK